MLQVNFSPFPVFRTKRLILRKIEHSDVNEVFFLRSDPDTIKYIDKAPAASVKDATAHIDRIEDLRIKNEAINWGISLKEDDKMIGNILIWNIKKEHYRAELGYVLHPAFHRKGIMKEALETVMAYGFNTLKLHSMEAIINPGNDASARLLETSGFVKEACFKENYFFNGKFLDTAIYSKLR